MRRHLRRTPPPLNIDVRVPVGVGTALWAAALVAVVLLRDRLSPDQSWWIWTCAASTVGGLLGLWFVPLIERRRKDE